MADAMTVQPAQAIGLQAANRAAMRHAETWAGWLGPATTPAGSTVRKWPVRAGAHRCRILTAVHQPGQRPAGSHPQPGRADGADDQR